MGCLRPPCFAASLELAGPEDGRRQFRLGAGQPHEAASSGSGRGLGKRTTHPGWCSLSSLRCQQGRQRTTAPLSSNVGDRGLEDSSIRGKHQPAAGKGTLGWCSPAYTLLAPRVFSLPGGRWGEEFLGPWWWLVLGGTPGDPCVYCWWAPANVLLSFVCFSFQKASSKSAHGSKRKCPVCRSTLGETWLKTLCKRCIGDVLREQTAEQGAELAASVKELSSTFQSFQALFSSFQLPQPQSSVPPAQ